MKKRLIATIMIILLIISVFGANMVYAAEENNVVVENETTDRAIDEETESQLV